ncbi:MAG TPA: 3-phosphoshikimate 1-carboxyvinyltransferase [Alphaproteobacteria bacterium]|nr:3-phosphoshikimate 1-carboxyvinyltransferase [Alphaproteobacteria bacterium]
MYLTAKKSKKLKGKVNVPGDKSISHRALIFASQAIGECKISGLLESEDVLNTKKSLQKLGINIEKKRNDYFVSGNGIGGLSEPDDILDFGNSGTGSRLMIGLLSSQNFKSYITGDSSLRGRPMARVIKPLEKMGAKVNARQGNLLPALVEGNGMMLPLDNYEMEVPSAQVKSAILLAAMNISGTTTIIEKERTRDHTESMMKYFGMDIKISEKNGRNVIKFTGQKEYKAKNIIVPSDPSSAAFPIVAAIITEGSEILCRNILINPTRIGLFETLKEMGARLEYKNIRTEAGEKIADIKASYSPDLKGVKIPAERAPSMIDEYPILGVAAACAKGDTVMNGLAELRVKESNRLELIKKGLIQNGIKAVEKGDSLIVTGGKLKGGVTVTTHGDHRIAMSFLVAGLVAAKPIKVDEPHMIATSFPEFKGLMNKLGADIR